MARSATTHRGRVAARVELDPERSTSWIAQLATDTPLKLAPARTRDRDGAIELVVMEASPGLFPGDRYDLDWALAPGARARIGTQAYLRVHGTPESTGDDDAHPSVLRQRIDAGPGARVELRPEPIVLHDRADLDAALEVHLRADATAIVVDVTTAGRIAHGERLRFTRWRSCLDLHIDGQLVAASRQLLEPAAIGVDVAARLAGGATHWATLYAACGAWDAATCEQLRERMQAMIDETARAGSSAHGHISGAADLLERAGVVVQLRGNSAQPLVALLDRLATPA